MAGRLRGPAMRFSGRFADDGRHLRDQMKFIPDKACGASSHEPAGLAFQGVFLSV
jgi:hypothetical protein